MCLAKAVDEFVTRLKDCEALEGVSIIKAYPFVKKPTKLDNVVIAVSPAQIESKAVSIGEDNMFSTYTIDADVFIPQELGSPEMWKYIQAVLLSQAESFPVAVATSQIKANDKISCYTAKCSFTYNGELELLED